MAEVQLAEYRDRSGRRYRETRHEGLPGPREYAPCGPDGEVKGWPFAGAYYTTSRGRDPQARWYSMSAVGDGWGWERIDPPKGEIGLRADEPWPAQQPDLAALVRTLEKNQAALIQRVEQLEHAAGLQRYVVNATREPRLQRRIGDYCPDALEPPATLDPVEHALFNQALMLARREDF